jgi:malate dehydrogenase|tara:strand:- start:529 stop:1443 length:915 start_codon:yes stop_codon:yes gene_type:complete
MITIVGAGRIGSSVASNLIFRELDDIMLVDIIKGLPQGEALDLGHMAASYGINVGINGSNNFADITGSDIIIVTAGLPRKLGMTRLDLLHKNSEIISDISQKILKYAPDSMILMVTNPLDMMTYVTLKITGFSNNRVFGMGGTLDSARFRYFISKVLGVNRSSVEAIVIGMHGEFMLPLPKFSKVNGKPLTDIMEKKDIDKVVEMTRMTATEVIALKGGTIYAPSNAVGDMIESIIKDKKNVLPLSTYLNGEYNTSELCIGVPATLGKDGVQEIIELQLENDEETVFLKGVKSLKKAILEINLN